MSDWEKFVNLDNLRLAWNRILRSAHGITKERLALRAFNFSLEENLSLLADKLNNDTYEPSEALKIYKPKKAGTLRTIAILTVPDRIVYQGICNVIATKSNPDIQMMANHQVYAHLPASPNSMYALRLWKVQYGRFIRALEHTWRRGNQWLVKTDIASFYDSIDHDLLIETLRNRWAIDKKLLNLLKKCLHTWSLHVHQRYLRTGLPQGYEASDLLSTLFLNTVDRDMCSKGYDTNYLRYVDDIRMLLPRQDKASRALIDLDLSMKSIGLILQTTTKTTIQKIDSLDSQRDPQWGLLSLIDQSVGFRGENTQRRLRQLFFDATRELETNEFAESHLVFALKRLDAHEDVGDQVLLLLDRMPWRSYELIQYLHKFKSDHHIIRRLRRFVENHRVYGWHLANCLGCLSHIAQPDDFYAICKEWLSDSKLPWYQKLAAAEALSKIMESATFCDSCSETEQNPLVRKGLLASCYKLADDTASQQRVIRKMLQDDHEEIKRTGIYFLLSHSELSWEEFSDLEGDIRPIRALIPDSTPQKECFISRTLSDFFQVDGALDISFEDILEGDYNTARQHLRTAIGAHDTSPSRYVCRLNNFNIILTWSIYKHHLPSVNCQKDEPVNNWNRREFRDPYPVIAGAFLKCHEVRCNCAEPHPYSVSLGAISEEVTHTQKDDITNTLKPAYREFVQLFS